MKKELFISLKTQLNTLLGTDGLPLIKTIGKWNNQQRDLMNEQGSKVNLFPMPAVFFAFKTAEIMQGGEGVQIYDPLDFELHILDWMLDAADGTFEENLEIFDISEKVWTNMQKFRPGNLTDDNNPGSSCIRVGEEEDNDHRGISHFIQRYRTTYVDNGMQEPVGGDTYNPIANLEANLTVDGSTDPDEPHKYTFTPAP